MAIDESVLVLLHQVCVFDGNAKNVGLLDQSSIPKYLGRSSLPRYGLLFSLSVMTRRHGRRAAVSALL